MWELSGGHLNLRQTASKLNFLKNTQYDVKEKQKKKINVSFIWSRVLLSLLICPQKLQYSKNPQPKNLVFRNLLG